MKTATERETAFRNDLEDLLAKHGATMEITDDGEDYGVSSVAIITMYSMWDINNELIADYTEFKL